MYKIKVQNIQSTKTYFCYKDHRVFAGLVLFSKMVKIEGSFKTDLCYIVECRSLFQFAFFSKKISSTFKHESRRYPSSYYQPKYKVPTNLLHPIFTWLPIPSILRVTRPKSHENREDLCLVLRRFWRSGAVDTVAVQTRNMRAKGVPDVSARMTPELLRWERSSSRWIPHSC